MFKVDLESAKVEVVNLENPLTSVDGIALQFNGEGLVAVCHHKNHGYYWRARTIGSLLR
jgi:hypothetical protein